MNAHKDIELPHLISSLKLARKPPLTSLAKSLETAASLRRQPPSRRACNTPDLNETNSRGYTRGQSLQGGFQSAIKSNRAALERHFARAIPVMLEAQWDGLLTQTIDAITAYGIERKALSALVTSRKAPERDENGLLPDEADAYAAFTNRDWKALNTMTEVIYFENPYKAPHN